ncbi:MAG: glycoside hydrolase family 9 protein [Cellulomonadaceae bacterium]|jgi:endoglucanase|nr:glycoside hydrolase family 9 protein [Cellulomonadaceae bacterium]
MTATITVNQLGYLTTGPKGATILCDSEQPCAWQLLDESDAVVTEGMTQPRGEDPTAGSGVHVIDFTTWGRPGRFRLKAACSDLSDWFSVGDDLYAGVLHDALTLFTLQRSGFEITEDIAGPEYARAAGHLDVAPNLGDGAVKPLPAGLAVTDDGVDLYEGWTGDYTVDARGGWYDAGDMGKYAVNGGISVAGLLSIAERALRGAAVPSASVELALQEATWELDFMSRMRVPAGEQYAGMVLHKVADRQWTGLPTLPADDAEVRDLHRPSTAATLNVAAVAAQAGRVFRVACPEFGQAMEVLARETYAAARANEVILAPDTNVLNNHGSGPYNDTDIDDEFYWAAAEMYLTFGEDEFLSDLRANPYHLGGDKSAWSEVGFDWRDTAAWVRLQLALVDSALPEREDIRADVCAQADALIAQDEPFGQLYTATDNAYAWGSNGMIANNAVIVAAAAEISGEQRHRDAALAGLDYLFGRNALSLSYVTGYGTRYVRNQHSRWFAHSLDASLPEPPAGTLSGGPNSGCGEVAEHLAGGPAQLCFIDDIGSYTTNEMTINWNAALATIAAYAASCGPIESRVFA